MFGQATSIGSVDFSVESSRSVWLLLVASRVVGAVVQGIGRNMKDT